MMTKKQRNLKGMKGTNNRQNGKVETIGLLSLEAPKN
jgi:hypothetical protein